MAEPILIGTRGWQQVEWAEGFYPPELPPEWRFCFYSNRLRSVLVPAETWEGLGRDAVTQWVEDSDPAFRFVLELPRSLTHAQAPARLSAAVEEFFSAVEPIAPRLAGLLARPAPAALADAVWFEELLDSLGDYPLCLDAPTDAPAAALALAARHDAGRCWHVAPAGEPAPGGRLRVALAPAATPSELRRLLERLHRWPGAGGRATLYFDGPGAARAAEEARILAELMAI